MIPETMWATANQISSIAGLAADAILVTWFYSFFLKKRRLSVYTGITYFMTMMLLYFSPVLFAGTIAYAAGVAAVCLVSALIERENIPQKVFLSMTIYLLEWISSEIALLPWKWVGRISYLNERVQDPGQRFALYVVALIFYVTMQTVVFYAEVRLISRIYAGKKEQMEWRELALLVSPYAALIAGYWISSFMADAYEHASGGYIWIRYPAYDYIRPAYSVCGVRCRASICVQRSWWAFPERPTMIFSSCLTSPVGPGLSVWEPLPILKRKAPTRPPIMLTMYQRT